MQARTLRTVTAVAAAAVLAAGCSTKADNGSGDGETGDVKTDFGVTDDTISLLELSDLSGVFKSLGLAYHHGLQTWADEVNEAGGICGRDIELVLADSAYKVDNAVPLYEQHKNDVLGIATVGGSHILAALKQKIDADGILTTPASWASVNLESESIFMMGQTYDIEMLNGLSYLQEQGMIADGDTIGHIYVDSEFGQNAALGSAAYAEEHGMNLVEASISSTDTDMTATMTKMKDEGVTAIAVTTPPAALGSIAVQNVQQGLGVPLMGSNPTFSPTLLEDGGVESALGNYYMISSVVPIGAQVPKAQEILESVTTMTEDAPDIGSILGYTWGIGWSAVLEKACEEGDLTREGILAAKSEISSLDMQDLMGPQDFSSVGTPAGREALILQADKATPGNLVITQDLFESEDAKNYKAPLED